MAQVSVRINGFVYTVGCEDGQEQHLLAMAQQVESRIESIKALGGVSAEAQLLVLSSLLMADEIHDLKLELDGARAAAMKAQRKEGGEAIVAKPDRELTRKINRLAVRAEQIAADLEHPQL
jgi:cell division protein ZapA